MKVFKDDLSFDSFYIINYITKLHIINAKPLIPPSPLNTIITNKKINHNDI